MVSVSLGALLALLAPAAAPPLPNPSALDRDCYRLMAELAADEDLRISAVGMVGAQYFLGRLDARSPDHDPASDAAAPLKGPERERLVGRCGDLMGAAGRDFRALGERMVRSRPTV